MKYQKKLTNYKGASVPVYIPVYSKIVALCLFMRKRFRLTFNKVI